MASSVPPPKPWEINRAGGLPSNNNYENLRSSSDVGETRTAPPVPIRPSQQRVPSPVYRPSWGGGYGGSYGLGGHGMYGGYGSSMYGGGGIYNTPYRTYGPPGTVTFTQQAEENTRQAFQSAESLVRAFTSVSTMLESTLGAVYSSFRAVLDVADHFSRVRATFTDILSSITIFRFLRYLYRRALALLRLQPCEEAWDSVAPGSKVISKPGSSQQKRSWPMMLFVAVVIGGPYLMWRSLRGISSQKQSTMSWMNGEGDHVIARADFDFRGASDEELSFNAGDKIVLAPRDLQPHIRGWLLGTMDGKTPGYLPANHVKILGLKKGRSGQSNAQSSTNLAAERQATPNLTTNEAEEEWKSIHGESPPTNSSTSQELKPAAVSDNS